MKKEITLPIGRLVQGSAFVPNDKDHKGNPRTFKSGANIGKPNPQYYVGFAIAKNDPAFAQVWAAMNEVARAAFPHLFGADGNCVLPTFAWKMVDGDGYDTTGKPNSSKEGFAGHFVLRLTSGFAPKVFLKGRYDPSQQVMDARELPTGYYIRALIDVTSNDDATKPGIYLNLKLVEVDKPGPVITSGPSASDAFAATASPGAYAGAPVSGLPMTPPNGLPLAPAQTHGYAPAVGGMPVTATGYAGAAVPPTPSAPNVGAIASPVAPAPVMVAPAPHMVGVAAPVVAPPPAMVPPPPPPAPVRQMTATATAPYEAYIAAGYTDAMLVQMGLMVG